MPSTGNHDEQNIIPSLKELTRQLEREGHGPLQYNELSAVLEVISMCCGRNSFTHSFSKYLCVKLLGYSGELSRQRIYPHGAYRLVEETDIN